MTFEFKRKVMSIFTISELVKQLAIWVKDNKQIPSAILLPPEEYVFLGWYRESASGYTEKIPWDTFRGIPIKLTTKKQKCNFVY